MSDSASNVVIRPLNEQDIHACARIMADTALWQRYQVTPARAERRFQQGWEKGAAVFVAEQQGDVVGFVWCVPRGAFDRSGYIALIGVDTSRRKQGIGARLLHHAEAFLARHSADVFLLVSDFNVSAQRFYERHGYVRVGALPDYVLPGVTELIYRKRLR